MGVASMPFVASPTHPHDSALYPLFLCFKVHRMFRTVESGYCNHIDLQVVQKKGLLFEFPAVVVARPTDQRTNNSPFSSASLPKRLCRNLSVCLQIIEIIDKCVIVNNFSHFYVRDSLPPVAQICCHRQTNQMIRRNHSRSLSLGSMHGRGF